MKINILESFFFINKNKIENLPEINKFILCITSLWLLIPIYYGFFNIHKLEILLLTILLCNVCIISLIFWNNPKSNSLLHYIDKISAWLIGIALIFITLFTNNGKNKINIMNFIIIIISIVLSVSLSNYFFSINSNKLQLLTHLIFRYICFSWSYILISSTNININNYIILSLCCIIHVIYCYYFYKN